MRKSIPLTYVEYNAAVGSGLAELGAKNQPISSWKAHRLTRCGTFQPDPVTEGISKLSINILWKAEAPIWRDASSSQNLDQAVQLGDVVL